MKINKAYMFHENDMAGPCHNWPISEKKISIGYKRKSSKKNLRFGKESDHKFHNPGHSTIGRCAISPGHPELSSFV